ncbi:MAG: CoA-binding protein [Armatimonadota bacterium]|nr:CoA-binding protein [Armatimonadota bacterium]MDR7427064.1 CoA-binding protein [Armatimonadota bacterium]MDR7465524.1 CoA-binding protein [Armatimonadota bacterium]MDR7468723.1 CoA-binding protein [Armatimonadota bacterium]MDR7474832.1 CoA-binding protein [Armatimonadota bacterium]
MALTWEDVQQILKQARTIAVVGLSDRPHRDSYQVAAYLQQQGYRIIPVNPRVKEVLGEKAYPNLREVPEPVDVVQIFRRSEEVPPVVEDAIAIGARVVWMQSGIVNEEAAARAAAAGLRVVMNACMRSAHRTLRAAGRL